MDPERGEGRGMGGGADVGEEEEEGYIITESIKRVFFIKPKRKLPFRSPPPAIHFGNKMRTTQKDDVIQWRIL